jgi:hypothetical protein
MSGKMRLGFTFNRQERISSMPDNKAKTNKKKRPSKGQRIHTRRLKQEAGKTGPVHK